nr:MAG TPA: hypothetical protein [Bacteriophage sp.]
MRTTGSPSPDKGCRLGRTLSDTGPTRDLRKEMTTDSILADRRRLSFL